MEDIFKTAELVKKFGTDTQKASYKKNGKLMPKIRNAIIKTVEQYYESVRPIKQGREISYVCSGKRTKKAERKDKRSNNGQGQLVGEFELKSLVINYLIQNNNSVKPMSAVRWLMELGIVDKKLTGELYGARGVHIEKLQEQFSKVIMDYNKADSDIEMLDEFIQNILKSMKASLVSAFKKLDKAAVIIHRKEVWGNTTKNVHRKLKQKEVNEIDSLKRNLLAKHGIKSNDLFKTNMKEVKAFKQEFEGELQKQLGLNFYYDAHFCVIQNSDLEVNDFLHSIREKGVLELAIGLRDEHIYSMTQVYKDKFSERSLELARGREKNITNTSDSDRVKSLKIMKHYVLMWELLLNYFRCTSSEKSNPFAIEAEVPESIELTKKERIKEQANQSSQNIEQQCSAVGNKSIVEPPKYFNEIEFYEYEGEMKEIGYGREIINYEYHAAMEAIRDEIREYEEKYVDKAMQRITHEAVIKELTRKVTAEESIAEIKKKLQLEKELERKEWEKLFEGGQPIKKERTTNNPLEQLMRIRKSSIDKGNS